jgi:hypothetical protein
MNDRFSLGRLLATPGALAALEHSGQSPAELLERHARGDWGEICDEDKRLNNASLRDGSRLLSSYRTTAGVLLWVITDAADDAGQRQATTILLPEEY